MSLMTVHDCKYPLLVDLIPQGKLFLAEVYDPMIKDHAERIYCCPQCGKSLGHEERMQFLKQAMIRHQVAE